MNKTGEIEIGERTISSEQAKTNHYKMASPKQQSRRYVQFTLHIIYMNFEVVFFADNFRECATLDAVYGGAQAEPHTHHIGKKRKPMS